MKKVFGMFGMTIGGWVGWAIGALVSIFTAFILSMIGTGVGLYFGHKLARRLAP